MGIETARDLGVLLAPKQFQGVRIDDGGIS